MNAEPLTRQAAPTLAGAGQLPGERLLSWVSTVDHKRVAILYMATTLVFFAAGGVEALLMRIQLAFPNNHFVSPDAYDQLFPMQPGDSLFFDADAPHGPEVLVKLPSKYLSIISYPQRGKTE